jgi:hypothetical protein
MQPQNYYRNLRYPAIPFAANRYQTPEPEPAKAFLQAAPDPEAAIPPHKLFGLFTYEIILEKKTFVR